MSVAAGPFGFALWESWGHVGMWGGVYFRWLFYIAKTVCFGLNTIFSTIYIFVMFMPFLRNFSFVLDMLTYM